MLNNLVNIGFGNFVNSTRVITILSPDSAPVKRLKEKQAGKVVMLLMGGEREQ